MGIGSHLKSTYQRGIGSKSNKENHSTTVTTASTMKVLTVAMAISGCLTFPSFMALSFHPDQFYLPYLKRHR